MQTFKETRYNTQSRVMNVDINITTVNDKLFKLSFNVNSRTKIKESLLTQFPYFEIDYVNENEVLLLLKSAPTENTFPFQNCSFSRQSIKLYNVRKKTRLIAKLNLQFKSMLDTHCTSIPYKISTVAGNVIILKRCNLSFNLLVIDPLLTPTKELIENFLYGTQHTI